jgi:hypothetical protein
VRCYPAGAWIAALGNTHLGGPSDAKQAKPIVHANTAASGERIAYVFSIRRNGWDLRWSSCSHCLFSEQSVYESWTGLVSRDVSDRTGLVRDFVSHNRIRQTLKSLSMRCPILRRAKLIKDI